MSDAPINPREALANLGLDRYVVLHGTPLPADLAGHLKMAKCPHCRRRPELARSAQGGLELETGLGDLPETPATAAFPRLEVIPCCSARYAVEFELPKDGGK